MSPRNHYHETVPAGAQLDLYERVAAGQDREVLDWFLARSGPASAETCHAATLAKSGAPLTSTRRAITNLTSAGHLTRTPRKEIGQYGRPVWMWQAAGR